MARLFPSGGLPQPLPVDDQIDLRFTPICPKRFSMSTRVKSCGRNGTKPPKLPPAANATGQGKSAAGRTNKSCHLLPTSATFCTLGALAQEAQVPAWPGFTIVQAASAAVYQWNSDCTMPETAPFGQRGTGTNMVIALIWRGSRAGYDSGWLNCTLLLNYA